MIGALGKLLGFGPSGQRKNQQSVLGQMGQQSRTVGDWASSARGDYNRANAGYQSALMGRQAQLRQNPYASGAGRSQYLGQALSGAGNAYQGARANLQSSLAARGIQGPAAAGAMANLEGMRARQVGDAYQDWAGKATEYDMGAGREMLANAQQPVGFYGGQSQQLMQMLQSLLGQQYQGYGELAQADEQGAQGLMNLLTQGAGLYGQYDAMRRQGPQYRGGGY